MEQKKIAVMIAIACVAFGIVLFSVGSLPKTPVKTTEEGIYQNAYDLAKRASGQEPVSIGLGPTALRPLGAVLAIGGPLVVGLYFLNTRKRPVNKERTVKH
jgi:hypothetical protein